METTAKTPQTARISDETFTRLVKNAKCDTADELGSVGFTANLGGIHLTFAGHSDENYEAYVEISRKKNGKWIPARATDLQRKALQEKLDMHVEDIEQDQRRQRESNRAYSQEVDTFGMPGALYGKLY